MSTTSNLQVSRSFHLTSSSSSSISPITKLPFGHWTLLKQKNKTSSVRTTSDKVSDRQWRPSRRWWRLKEQQQQKQPPRRNLFTDRRSCIEQRQLLHKRTEQTYSLTHSTTTNSFAAIFSISVKPFSTPFFNSC